MINPSSIRIKIDYPTIVGMMMVISLGAIADVQASSDADYNFLTDADWHNCQQIGTNYQEVYAFETPSFYINICQKGNVYFYSSEAKQGDTSSIFIPATPLRNNLGFQAQNGNASYVVTLPFPKDSNTKPSSLDPEEAILTIKRNDRLVAIESSLNKYCYQSAAIAFDKIKLNQLATIPQHYDGGMDLLSKQTQRFLPADIFHSNLRFDFYRIGGELHRLVTCT